MEFIGFPFVQIVLALGTALVGAICALLVRRATRLSSNSKRASLIAFAFPILVGFYVEAGFFAYGIGEIALGKDSFLDGVYHYQLVNGYQLVILDKMPEMSSVEQYRGDSHTMAVDQVRAVQVAGNALLVTAHQGRDASDWGRDKPANTYIAIDTKTSKITDYPTLDALRSDAASRGISLQLIATEDALNQAASLGWAGRMFLIVLLTPPVVLAIWLLRQLRYLTQHPMIAGQHPHPA